MAKKPTVIDLTMTCSACPSQWEGTTKDGLDVYIRYRYGWLSARIDRLLIYKVMLDDSLAGVMSTDEMQRHLREVVNFQ